MALYQALGLTGNFRPAAVSYAAGDEIAVRMVALVGVALLINDIIEAGVIPAGFVPVDVEYDVDKLDSNGSPTIKLDCGIMSGAVGLVDPARTVGTEFFSQDTSPQAGGMARTARLSAKRVLPDHALDRSIGFKVQTAPATAVASLTGLTNDRGRWAALTAYATGDFITLPNGVRLKCTTAGVTGNSFLVAMGTTAYNNTVSDGTAVWTVADPCIGLTVYCRPHVGGY